MNANERAELADMVAQAVIDRIEERRQVDMLVELVLRRMAALQEEDKPAAAKTATVARQPCSHETED